MKKLIPLLATCVLLLDTSSFAQEIEWQNTIGGDSTEFLYSIQQTVDGGYILGGSSKSNISGDKNENRIGDYDYWIIKTDSTGNIQWQNTIGGGNNDEPHSIQQTADGGYILGGSSNSNISGDKTENNLDTTLFTYDYWVVKLDAAGNIQWQNTIGGSSNDELYSLQQTSDGGYILAGYSASNISGDKTENSNGGNDFWIVKTDSSGNIQWQNTIGGNNNDELYPIQQTADEGYILGGASNSDMSGDKSENSNGGNDFWVVKTDSIGNIQWQNTIGGSLADIVWSVQQTTDGGYILGGSSTSSISGDKTEDNWDTIPPFSLDYWVVKTDSAGNIQWQNTIGGNSSDQLTSAQQTADGGYILGGLSYSNISGDKAENNNGVGNYWILKTDATGIIQWQNTIGGSIYEVLNSTEQTSDGGYVLGGNSNSSISGDKIENSNGISDYWIVKVTDIQNFIAGELFIDANSNALHDAGEPDVNNKMVTEITTGRFSFSQQNGNFNVSVLDSGNFSVYPTSINYYNTVPATHSAYFSSIHQIDSLNDFAFQPTGVFNDLCVTITPLVAFRSGMNANYMINYENVGTTTLSPTVIFFPDNDVTFVSANPVASSVTVDSVVWNFGPLTPYQTGSILVTVNVNVGTLIGTAINSLVRIEPVAGDANTACNYDSSTSNVVAALDPNKILVDEDTVFTTQLTNPLYLQYIIYFQNTGNDTAFNVRVLNNLPQELDVTTFEFVASSHPMNITYGAHAQLMTFTFDNILLPDSNVNEPASHGFVRYRIKPKTTLVAGDSIKNTAFIYFDFNLPVQTNTAVTEIVLPTGTGEFNVQSLKLNVFPNPAGDYFEFRISSRDFGIELKRNAELTLMDLFGRKVFQSAITNQQSTIKVDISGLAKGIYVIELIVMEKKENKIYRSKLVKE